MKTSLVFVSFLLFCSVFAQQCEKGGYTLHADATGEKYFVHDIIQPGECNNTIGCYSEITYFPGHYMTLHHGCVYEEYDLNPDCTVHEYKNWTNIHSFCCEGHLCNSFEKELNGTNLMASPKVGIELSILDSMIQYYDAVALAETEEEADPPIPDETTKATVVAVSSADTTSYEESTTNKVTTMMNTNESSSSVESSSTTVKIDEATIKHS